MSDTVHTDCIITLGRALVCAVEVLGEIEPLGWFGRVLAAYQRRLRWILGAVPDWETATILGAPPAARWTDD
jgi:hypothetical protein